MLNSQFGSENGVNGKENMPIELAVGSLQGPNLKPSRLTPSLERKLHKLEDQVRRLESKLRKAERREAVIEERLLEISSENRNITQELQDTLEAGEEVSERLKTVQRDRDQYYTWWVNEVKFSQELLQKSRRYPVYEPGCVPEVPISRRNLLSTEGNFIE
ncbi:hypothetical protein BKA70DRAFT_1239721 [Coprinopsis sp. MPI-PUGE-AT-0042]|nr:hypothetical protein BKA70DRAFT_1239721 [Coprinopsis sp. MPI-PUGE-AT-0042]